MLNEYKYVLCIRLVQVAVRKKTRVNDNMLVSFFSDGDFNKSSYVVFGLSFLLRQGQDFLLEIQNHSRHTFSQYSKEGKRC